MILKNFVKILTTDVSDELNENLSDSTHSSLLTTNDIRCIAVAEIVGEMGPRNGLHHWSACTKHGYSLMGRSIICNI